MSIGYNGEVARGIIPQRLSSHMTDEKSLLKNQFGFRKARSTVDASNVVVGIATKARRGTSV